MLTKISSAPTELGFTLIELIVVILLIGILSVNVMLRWPVTNINLNLEAQRVLNDIRYTQMLSMTTGQRYRFVGITSNAYQIQNQAGTPIMLPSGSTTQTLASGSYFSTTSNLPNNLIAFDTQGIPYTDTANTALATMATISITSGTVSRMLQISPQTGFGALQ